MYTIYTIFFRRLSPCIAKFLPVKLPGIPGLDQAFKRQLIMSLKLTTVLMITFLLQAAASSNAQNLSLIRKNVAIKYIFREIRKQTGYNVLWEQDKLQADKMINASFKQASIDEVMKTCLAGQQLTYAIEANTIVIKPLSVSLINKVISLFKDIEVKGKIIDEKGLPLPSVSIQIKGTKTWYKTDENGNFQFKVPNADATLIFTYLGYKSQEMPVTQPGSMNITLLPVLADLTEVVVVGYGKQKKANLTGAVDAITSKQLENRPIANLGQGLQGLIPNLNISIANGKAGTAPEFNIRGYTSLNGGSPLILVDNVPFSASELLMLNPSDVESISVLKDAASAAIYGSRAAFGVVLITTKSAKTGKLNVSVNSYTGIRTIGKLPEVVTDPYTVLQMKNEAAFPLYNPAYNAKLVEAAHLRSLDPSLPNVMPDPADPTKWFYIGNTDWLREGYNKTAATYNAGVTISQKNDKLSYYLSAGYFSQNGIARDAKEKNNLYNMRGKVDINVTKWLNIANNTLFSAGTYQAPTILDDQTYFQAINRSNITDIPKNPDGSWTSAGAGSLGAVKEGGRKNITNHTVQTTFSFDASLIKDIWSLKGDATFRRVDTLVRSYEIPVAYKIGPDLAPPLNSTSSAANRNINIKYDVVNLYTEAHKKLGNHFISGLVGYNQEHYINTNFYASRKLLISTAIPSVNLATGDQTITERIGEWAVQGIFYRLNYNFKEKYLLEFNGRYDGSSRFAPGQRWAFVPSASAGWLISEESFFKPIKEAIGMNQFKVRGSYGVLGNQASVNEYDYLALMESKKNSQILDGKQPDYVNPPAAISSNFTWEKVSTINIGADLNFFNNKLELNLDKYTRYTKNMLVPGKLLPGVFGTASPTANSADLKTKGWEVRLSWRDAVQVGGSPFSYNATFALSDSRAYITRFDNPTKSFGKKSDGKSNYYEGMEIGEIWGLETEGFFQNAEELKNHANQTAVGTDDQRYQYFVGDIKFKDRNGDGKVDFGDKTVNNPGDLYKIGNSQIRLPYSVDLSAAWKGFDVRVFIQGVAKRDWYAEGSNIYFWGIYAQPWTNVTTQNMDHWSPETPNAYFPRIKAYSAEDTGEELGIPNTRYLQNAAYLRVKNITIGYTLPKSILKKLKLDNVHFYVSGENLFEYSKLKVKLDPEGLQGNIYPFQRTYSFGMNLNF
ncbi:TonB-linked SusC/RagA family outer membrane protein [Pedobacter sp. UYP1]